MPRRRKEKPRGETCESKRTKGCVSEDRTRCEGKRDHAWGGRTHEDDVGKKGRKMRSDGWKEGTKGNEGGGFLPPPERVETIPVEKETRRTSQRREPSKEA
mmetsp:Transcript_1966/g.12439  ORF Transcript_1966/g.12439 Transcript_1966/m.12439 type:complete len:101 (+) Transcript_1966:342-644(+)